MEEGRPPAVWPRLALAGASAVLLLLSALHQFHDARERARVERFLSDFSLDRRRPDLAATARVEGAADLAMAVAVRAATLDVIGRTPLAGLEPALRELWLRSVTTLPEEVAAARSLALDALSARPAWAFHALALAELTLSDEWREPFEARRRDRWLLPMRVASAWAPAAPGIRASWAAASVERWPLLSEGERREARTVLCAALADERFQEVALPAVVAMLGMAEGLSFLPETPAALAVARRAVESSATFDERVLLYERWRAAERTERRAAVAEILDHLEGGRGARAAAAAWAFLGRHPVELFDDLEGREQARVVLRAVGDGRPGSWRTDPRGVLVRWFLASPHRPGPGRQDLVRAASGLVGISEGERALLLLLAGNDFGWRRVLDQADSLGSSEWTPFFVEQARRQLEKGDPAEAEAALGAMSRFDLEQCDVLLVRRDVARALEQGPELARLRAAWPLAFPKAVDVPAWPASGAGTLSVCVDPEADGSSALVVTVGASEPVLAWWGWDGGREGVVRLEAGVERALSVPLAGLRGARSFSLGPLLGGGLSLKAARIRPSEPTEAPPRRPPGRPPASPVPPGSRS